MAIIRPQLIARVNGELMEMTDDYNVYQRGAGYAHIHEFTRDQLILKMIDIGEIPVGHTYNMLDNALRALIDNEVPMILHSIAIEETKAQAAFSNDPDCGKDSSTTSS